MNDDDKPIESIPACDMESINDSFIEDMDEENSNSSTSDTIILNREELSNISWVKGEGVSCDDESSSEEKMESDDENQVPPENETSSSSDSSEMMDENLDENSVDSGILNQQSDFSSMTEEEDDDDEFICNEDNDDDVDVYQVDYNDYDGFEYDENEEDEVDDEEDDNDDEEDDNDDEEDDNDDEEADNDDEEDDNDDFDFDDIGDATNGDVFAKLDVYLNDNHADENGKINGNNVGVNNNLQEVDNLVKDSGNEDNQVKPAEPISEFQSKNANSSPKPTQEPENILELPSPPIEFIIGRRTVGGMVQYLCQRRGHAELQSTWEPVESLTCHELVAAYENDRAIRLDMGNRRSAPMLPKVRNV